MNAKRFLSMFLALTLVFSVSSGASAAVVRDEGDKIHYEPTEQGVHSDGGYIVDKMSYPTLGSGEVDGILTGEDQDRGQSYSWSMAEAGDYIYIGTCYNSTYFIYHDNIRTTLQGFQKDGVISPEVDVNKVAEELVGVMFGQDVFDNSDMMEWEPLIIAVNKFTGEAEIIFNERDHWDDLDENGLPIFRGYGPAMPVKNILSGYRMAVEYKDKLYFAGMGSPTATMIEVDPATNETKIAYYNTQYPDPNAGSYGNVSNGVHGLLVYDDEVLMCLAADDYDRDPSNGKQPGGLIVGSENPGAGLSQWRVVADQDDFDGLPAVMQMDGLNGGGIWDIIEFNGHLYVTIVTDRGDGKGHVNKQGFAMYRGDKDEDDEFTWTQIVGDKGTSGYGFGMGINYSMSCNMWVYDNHLYLGTYNDPMLDLAAVPATGNFELLYRDLDHSIYLYRMDENEKFEQIGGKNDNPSFPKGPIGNLGAGLGNNSNQYVWRMGVHNDEMYLGTYDTSTLTYMFTQLTDGQVATMDPEDMQGRVEDLTSALLGVLDQKDCKFLEKLLGSTVFSKPVTDLLQYLSSLATDTFEGRNPVPQYEQNLAKYEEYKKLMYKLVGQKADTPEIQAMMAEVYGEAMPMGLITDIRSWLIDLLDNFFKTADAIVYNSFLHNFVYYLGVNYYAQQCEPGFDLLVSNDGINFDAITRDGFGDKYNHGLRTICSTENGVYMGTANPFYGTQLWRMHSEKDLPLIPPEKPDPEKPDKPDPEKPDKPDPEKPDKPDPEKPDKPDPEKPDKPSRPSHGGGGSSSSAAAEVTFTEGEGYTLEARSGTRTNKDGSVVVTVNGRDLVSESRIPTVVADDPFYQIDGWAVKDRNDKLVEIDLDTYEFDRDTKVYAICRDIWTPFLDMKADRSDWYYQELRDLAIAGIVGGYADGAYKAENQVTWGAALKLVMLAAGYPEQAQVPGTDHACSGYLELAKAEGIVPADFSINLFTNIDRLEFAQITARALKLETSDIDNPFTDTDDAAVIALNEAGIINGYGDGRFGPEDHIKRSHIAAIIWRMHAFQEK